MDQLQQAREIISQVDREMCDLFLRRMEAVRQVAEYKQARGLAVFDGAREQEVLEKGAARVEDPALRQFKNAAIKSKVAVENFECLFAAENLHTAWQ